MSERQIAGIYGGYADVSDASDSVAGKAICLTVQSGFDPNRPPSRAAITLTEAAVTGLARLMGRKVAALNEASPDPVGLLEDLDRAQMVLIILALECYSKFHPADEDARILRSALVHGAERLWVEVKP